MRRLRRGPEFAKIGEGGIRYRASVIIKYEFACFVKTKAVEIRRIRRLGRRT